MCKFQAPGACFYDPTDLVWKTIKLYRKQFFPFLIKIKILNLISQTPKTVFLIHSRENMMRSLAELEKESSEINLKIRKLLLSNNSFEEGIEDKLTVIATIPTLRAELVKIQREIRERFPDSLG